MCSYTHVLRNSSWASAHTSWWLCLPTIWERLLQYDYFHSFIGNAWGVLWIGYEYSSSVSIELDTSYQQPSWVGGAILGGKGYTGWEGAILGGRGLWWVGGGSTGWEGLYWYYPCGFQLLTDKAILCCLCWEDGDHLHSMQHSSVTDQLYFWGEKTIGENN